MGAVAQVAGRSGYERTGDLRRMLTSAQLAEAIINEVRRNFAGQQPETNIFDIFPARAASFPKLYTIIKGRKSVLKSPIHLLAGQIS